MSDENGSAVKEKSANGFLTFGNVRDMAVIALMLVVGIRFATADFNIDLKDFSFTDLVSLFLAVSSVALSALFYFKADESSRTFYTHTYKFTKDVSEMLGRIDSGFGEKLRAIDQGYIGLSQKFDRFSFDPSLSASRAENSEAKKAEIEEQEARRQDIIEGLMQRADVSAVEKQELLQRLSTLSNELEQSKAELAEQRSAIDYGVSDGFKEFLTKFVSRYFSGKTVNASPSFYRDRFAKVLADPALNSEAKDYMQFHGLLDGHILTNKGVDFVRSIVKSF